MVIGCIGDSITQGVGASNQAPACAQLPRFLNKFDSVSGRYSSVNLGASGSATGDWLPDGPTLRGAIQNMTQAHVSVVQIMLGTNDAKVAIATSEQEYSARLQAITAALIKAGFKKIILHQPIFISNPLGQWDVTASNALISRYGTAITAIAAANRAYVFDGDHLGYEWFRIHTDESVDGIHPNDNGHVSLGFLWAMAYGNLFIHPPGPAPAPRNP